MAKRKVNKSEAIRKYLGIHPEAAPKEVGTALKRKGITVQPALVSNVKANMRKSADSNSKGIQGRRRGRPRNAELIHIDDLVLARDFAHDVGGIGRAKSALEALAALAESK